MRRARLESAEDSGDCCAILPMNVMPGFNQSPVNR